MFDRIFGGSKDDNTENGEEGTQEDVDLSADHYEPSESPDIEQSREETTENLLPVLHEQEDTAPVPSEGHTGRNGGPNTSSSGRENLPVPVDMEDENEFDPTNIDYAVNFDETTQETQMGRQLMVWDENGDGPFTGSWPRKMFEGAYDNPEQATWVGYQSDARTGMREVPIAFDAWTRHAAVFGTTGFGKTTLLKNVMTQIAYAGHGFAFIDPKGDGVVELLEQLPANRLDDVIWIEPNPKNNDKVVGLNFLEAGTATTDAEFQAEIESILDDLKGILKGGEYWGPRMNRILSNIVRGMIRSEKNYTLIDMYYILLDESYREMFAMEVDDPYVKKYAKVIAEEMDQSDLDPLVGRLQNWVENRIAREIISHQKSTVNIKDAVESGKIILVKNDMDSADVKRMIATGVMRRIWAAVKARDALDEDEEYNPYFLLVDEFDDVVSEDANVDKMLSKARSMGMRVLLCCQQPSQLPKDIRKAIFGNCDNLLALNPGEPDDASLIMKRFGEYSATDLLNLGRFKMFTRIMVNDEKSQPFITKNFPDYPPVRTPEEARDVIERSLDKYGTNRLSEDTPESDTIIGENQDDGMERDGDAPAGTVVGENSATASTSTSTENNDEDEEEESEEISVDEALEAILAVSLRNNQEYVSTEAVREELTYRVGEVGYQSMSANVFERIPDNLCETERRNGQTVLGLTEAGKGRVFAQDTGSSGSGGGDDHRYVLRRAYETFTRAGYRVTLPSQEGDELPDGVADVPIDMEATSLKEMREKISALEDEHPDVAEISDGRDVYIEAETSTIRKPKQTIKNLRKALREDRKCVFGVKDMSYKKSLEYHAKVGIGIMTDPPLVSEATYNDDGKLKERKFYNESKKMEVDDDVYAVRPADGPSQTEWWERWNGNVELIPRKEDGTIMSFNSGEDCLEADPEDVPYYYEYNHSDNSYIVTDNVNEQTHEYSDRDEFTNEWSPVYPPMIPEIELPHLPDEDDWSFVVFPDDDNEEYDQPMLVEFLGFDDNGEIKTELKPFLKHTETTSLTSSEPNTIEESDPEDEQQTLTEDNTEDGDVGTEESTTEETPDSESTHKTETNATEESETDTTPDPSDNTAADEKVETEPTSEDESNNTEEDSKDGKADNTESEETTEGEPDWLIHDEFFDDEIHLIRDTGQSGNYTALCGDTFPRADECMTDPLNYNNLCDGCKEKYKKTWE